MSRKKDSAYFNPPGKVAYPILNKLEIPELDSNLGMRTVPLPFKTWNFDTDDRTNNGGTWGFFTTDTKFMSLLFEPMTVYESGCQAVVEMNYTLDGEWPFYVGVTPIGRKRQFAWMLQEMGLLVAVDLNVPEKFADLNLSPETGVPRGFPAFGVRGESSALLLLKRRYERAKAYSGSDLAVFIVYGGGIRVQEWCINRNQDTQDNGETPHIYWFPEAFDVLKYDFKPLVPQDDKTWAVQRYQKSKT